MKISVDVNRRSFLKQGGVLAGVLAVGSPLTGIVPGRAWAAELALLSSAEGKTLMVMARTLAPHDGLDDAVYAMVAAAIDADAAESPEQLSVVRKGIADLGAEFAIASEEMRVGVLKKVEGTEFFGAVRQKTLQMVYSTQVAFAYFGYEGEAFSKGGYLLRGFDSLRWLPEVPEQDGGPNPLK